MPLKAYGDSSTAAQRLSAKGKPSGKAGNVGLTVKLRTRFSAVADQQPGIQFEDWLEQEGYGIGDNGHVYKK